MKAKLLLMATVLLMGVVCPVQASITDVTIQPEIPTFNDDISLLISGVQGSGGVQITDSTFIINGTDLELNIDLLVGSFTVITPWSHTENIGVFPIGTYDLTVNMLVDLQPSLNDTFTTSFEVVPEPTTFLIISAGILCLRRNKNR